MLASSKSLLVAVALVAVLNIASVRADEHTDKCIKLLSDSLAGVSISLGVHEFMQLVRSTLPDVKSEDYAALKRDQRVLKLEAAYPEEECNDLLDQVDELTMNALEGNPLCQRILSDDESSTLQMALKDSVLSHVYSAKEACFAFPPQGAVH